MPEGSAIPGLFERLQPRLQALEERRRRLRNTIIGGVVLANLGIGSCITAVDAPFGLAQLPAWRYGPLFFALLALTCFGVAFSRFLVPGVTGYVNYRSRFKKEVVSEVVRAVQPRALYFPDRHLKREVFNGSRLFRTQLDVFRGDDLLQGSAGGTPFECSELEASYTSGSGKSSRTHRVFTGLFFRIDLDRDLAGHTVVQPRSAAGGDRTGMQQVALDEAFDAEFTVFSTRTDEVRSLVTLELRGRLLELPEHAGAPLHLAFAGRIAYAALDYGRRLFEPQIAGAPKEADLKAMAAPLDVADDVVRTLGLDRGRRRPADPGFHASGFTVGGMEAIADRIASAGDVGIDDLSEAVGSSLGAVVGATAAAEPVAPPTHEPFARVTDSGGGLEVRYPMTFGTLLALAIWIALTPLLLAALGTWASPGFGEELSRLLADRAPQWREPAEALLAFPTAFLLGSLFLWWMFGSVLRHRPSVDAIGHDGVSIRRLFRVSPSVLPLSVVRRIDPTNRSLSLVRADRSLLRGGLVMLSPNLRSDVEARWLAAQITQALRRCGWRAAR